jgi:hypothetical protein
LPTAGGAFPASDSSKTMVSWTMRYGVGVSVCVFCGWGLVELSRRGACVHVHGLCVWVGGLEFLRLRPEVVWVEIESNRRMPRFTPLYSHPPPTSSHLLLCRFPPLSTHTNQEASRPWDRRALTAALASGHCSRQDLEALVAAEGGGGGGEEEEEGGERARLAREFFRRVRAAAGELLKGLEQ